MSVKFKAKKDICLIVGLFMFLDGKFIDKKAICSDTVSCGVSSTYLYTN